MLLLPHDLAPMRIGFYLKWNKNGHLPPKVGNVMGDEIVGEGLCKYLRQLPGVTSAELYAPNYAPPAGLDVMVYLNDTLPIPGHARKHVLYLQNFYDEGSFTVLQRLYAGRYDGYAFISEKILAQHLATHPHGLFLPFGVDPEKFQPQPWASDYNFDVTYVGNNIKGAELASRYLLPATRFNFGLFGNWRLPEDSPAPSFFQVNRWLKHRKAVRNTPPVLRSLRPFAKGSIANQLIPHLYSSAKIIINCTGVDSLQCGVITLRTFEVLACRGFLITDFAPPELQDCVVVSTGEADLQEKITYYLAHPEARDRIAANGHAYVQRSGLLPLRATQLHTYLTTVIGPE